MALLPLSLQALYDDAGNRVFEARLRVTTAGTNVPENTYADAEFTTFLPFPIRLRGNGTWPAIYVRSGAYRLRVSDPDGVVYDQIDGLVIKDQALDDEGGDGLVDNRLLFQTGDIKDRYATGTHPGWVRCNGRTIGSSVSSASERASDDCQALFVHLYTQDPNLAVSGGRGDSAQGDWEAGKTIALPDFRGRARIALDDLGNGAAGRLAGGLFGFGTPTMLGSYGGEASHAQSLAEMPAHNHNVTVTMGEAGGHFHIGGTDPAGGHFHDVPYQVLNIYQTAGTSTGVASVGAAAPNLVGYTSQVGPHAHSYTTSTAPNHVHALFASCAINGGGAAMNTLSPFILVSTYIKL